MRDGAAAMARRVGRCGWPGGAVLAMLLVPANLVLALKSDLPLFNEDDGLFPQSVVLLLGFAAIALLIVLRRPDLLVGKLLVLVCLGEMARQITYSYAYVGLITDPGSLPGGGLSSWLSQAVFAWPGYVALLIWVPLLFPDGRPPARWLRPLVWIGWVPIVSVLTIGVLLWNHRGTEFLLGPSPDSAPAPAAVDFLHRWGLNAVMNVAPWLALATIPLRYALAEPAVRRQLRWFAMAAVTIAITQLGDHVDLPYWFRLVNSAPWVPAAIAFAVLRERLYGIEVIVRRSLVYTGLITGVLAAYAAVVGVAAALLDVRGLGPSLVATALVAVLFQPAKVRLERAAEWWVFGGSRDPAQALSRLSETLRTGPELDALPGLCHSVIEAARLPAARITTTGNLVGAAGTGTGVEVEVPLAHRGQHVAVLTVTLRPGERKLSRAEESVVNELAPLLAAAVHALALAAELRVARERLVSTREEERRRLRRDLHDGLGPALAGITMEIQAARQLLTVDRAGAETVLASAEDWARDAIGEIRRVVYGLRPPVLDQLGLARAVEEHAAAVGLGPATSGLAISVSTDGALDELPAAAEVAAYLIVLEALTNVVRHSGARRCTVGISARDALGVEVIDDGAGLSAGTALGVGLTSMRERAEELGGTLTLTCPTGGGLRVSARLPLAATTTP